jgi:hypothetical protein
MPVDLDLILKIEAVAQTNRSAGISRARGSNPCYAYEHRGLLLLRARTVSQNSFRRFGGPMHLFRREFGLSTIDFRNQMIRPVISSIQALRAVAAVTVAIVHISGATTTLSDSNVWRWFNKMTLSVGHSGVDLFFVISGTIMYLISREASTNNLTAFYSFSVHRIFRIYRLYFLTFVFCVFIIFSGVRAPGTANLFQELTLDVSPVEHPVAWTLPYEVRFYLVVAIIILLFRRHLDAALCVWV